MPNRVNTTQTPAIDPAFEAGLVALEGKRVTVKVKVTKALDVSPGEAATAGFYYETVTGIVMSPPVMNYPKDNPDAPKVLCLVTDDARKQTYAIALYAIEEVDDDVQLPLQVQVAMGSLTNPLA